MMWYKGLLNTHSTLLEHYCKNRLAELMRTSKDRVYYTAKMIYWLSNPTVELEYPIVITQHPHGISSAHPGQSRLLAAYIQQRAQPIRLNTVYVRSELIVDAQCIDSYSAHSATVHNFQAQLKHYKRTAAEFERQWGRLTAWEFYSCVAKKIAAQKF
jgi:hypothetical protein